MTCAGPPLISSTGHGACGATLSRPDATKRKKNFSPRSRNRTTAWVPPSHPSGVRRAQLSQLPATHTSFAERKTEPAEGAGEEKKEGGGASSTRTSTPRTGRSSADRNGGGHAWSVVFFRATSAPLAYSRSSTSPRGHRKLPHPCRSLSAQYPAYSLPSKKKKKKVNKQENGGTWSDDEAGACLDVDGVAPREHFSRIRRTAHTRPASPPLHKLPCKKMFSKQSKQTKKKKNYLRMWSRRSTPRDLEKKIRKKRKNKKLPFPCLTPESSSPT
jgi:hypothetical protein